MILVGQPPVLFPGREEKIFGNLSHILLPLHGHFPAITTITNKHTSKYYLIKPHAEK